MPYGVNLQPPSGVPCGSTGRNGDRRTSRDQVPRPASQSPNYEHSVQEQESPIDCDTLVRFVQMCFNRLEGEERDKFLGQLASLLAAAEHMNGDAETYENSFKGTGARDRGLRSGHQGAARDRRPAQDAAIPANNRHGFLARFPEAANIRFSANGRY